MSENSAIEWTDHTFNPWIGCTKISPGCKNCYAEGQDKFRSWTPDGWGKGKPRKLTSEANWKKPLQWEREAERRGRRFRVFCASLADVFDPEVPDEWRVRLLYLIDNTPHLDWQLLTKRPDYALKFLESAWMYKPNFGNDPWRFHIGVSVENQQAADERIPLLLQIPAAVRFLSCEPLLGPVDLGQWMPPNTPHVDWVIVGGES